METVTQVVTWIQYLSGGGDTEYTRHQFCGGCGLHLEKPYGFARSLDEVMDTNDIHGPLGDDRRPIIYDRFCRYCGTELDPGPWKAEPINIRPVNHLDGKHGYHRGDSHVFAGFHPVNHYLGGTGDMICWCDPIVTAIPDGCEIAHRDIAR